MDFISILGTLGVGGLGGVLLSGYLTDRRERAKRKAEFLTRQLDEFYGPLLSLHNEIRARSELRVKVDNALDTAHVKAMLKAGRDMVEIVSDTHVPGIVQSVRDANQTFREILMPLYGQMVDVFRSKLWLAEPETRNYFSTLIEFVDVWDKILADRLPRDVAPAIGHTEANLKPFYEHLEATHDRLRGQLMK